MATQEEIDVQWKRLATHRARLAELLTQQAQHGSAFAPPFVSTGIVEARNDIRRVKAVLRDWRQTVDDHPDDEEAPPRPPSPVPSPPAPREYPPLLIALVSGAIVVAFVLGAFVVPSLWKPAPQQQSPMPGNVIERSDFARSTDGWDVLTHCGVNWQDCESIERAAQSPSSPVDRGVSYELQLNVGNWTDNMVRYEKPVQADLITAQFYIPDSPYLEDNWLGISAYRDKTWLAGTYTHVEPGRWTVIVLDLRNQYDQSNTALNTSPLFFQVEFSLRSRAGMPPKTIHVGLDNVVWYGKAGVHKFQEQPGAGRTVFDFETGLIGNWAVDSQRALTDTLHFTNMHTYRGQGAMEWNTQLADGENSFINTLWKGVTPPHGGWVAKVYLPADALPAGTKVWANLFTRTKHGWQGSTSQPLQAGQWITLIWDTRGLDWDSTDIAVGIQIGAEHGPYQGPIYIDDIQVFEQ